MMNESDHPIYELATAMYVAMAIDIGIPVEALRATGGVSYHEVPISAGVFHVVMEMLRKQIREFPSAVSLRPLMPLFCWLEFQLFIVEPLRAPVVSFPKVASEGDYPVQVVPP